MTTNTTKGKWDSSASGHLDCGEDYDACAVREIWGEIGLKLTQPPERIIQVEACTETAQEFVWVYRCVSEGPFTLHPEEIERGNWFAPEEITQWLAARPRGVCPNLRVDLETGCQRKAPSSTEKNLIQGLTVFAPPNG
jgi:isopentenyl-diphosphate Delta-isomerase